MCIACHSKKIKCDVQSRRKHGQSDCSNCASSSRECKIRPSKRERKRGNQRPNEINQCSANSSRNSAHNDLNPSGDYQTSDSNIVDESSTVLDTEVVFPDRPVLDTGIERTHDSRSSLCNIQISGFDENLSPRSVLQSAQDRACVPGPQMSASHTDTTPTQLGDVDTGFLQVYGPENQFDAENQALVAQLEHKYGSDLNPDLQHIFLETYFEYCYTWCPVLERATLLDEIARSPLLANALALASSHVQPPLLPHDGPEAYYKRARTIFYEDEEADSMMSLKAICLFYWWAPQSPSRVHKHSSWWWTSVIIRHAQQMNIHREPAPGDPYRIQLDLSLRRRIWWTAYVSDFLSLIPYSLLHPYT